MSYNVFPLSYALSAVVNFGFSFIALLGVMLVVWIQGQAVFSLNIFLIFIGLPALFLFCYGLSLLLSAMYTFFRDISHFYNVFLTLWMYLTPIFYTINMFDGGGAAGAAMKTIIRLNPMYYYVEYFRDVVYRCSAHASAVEKMEAANQFVSQSMIDAASLPGFGQTAMLYVIGLVTLLIGACVFMGTKRKFIYNI
jgi:ABC-type polysaccharide/polyol phosphate export permease